MNPRVVFFASDKPREQALARAFLRGAGIHRCRTEQRALCAEPNVGKADVIAMVGVKSRALWERVVAAGAIPIMLDKGYVRTRRAGARVWEFWRVAVGAHHPTETGLMRRKMPSDRFDALGLDPSPWRNRGAQIVIAGSSAKYHAFYGLPEPNEYYSQLVRDIRARTHRPIIYRPKPSFKDAVPIDGTEFSSGDETINDALWGAHALVTHGSNACFEAALLGVPSIVLGDAVAAPISSRSLDDLEEPLKGKREQWFANLAYHQFTQQEFEDGVAWAHLGKQIDEQLKRT
jgi:hypothetical protein